MFSEKNLINSVKIGLHLVLITPLFFHRSFIFPFIAPKVFIFQSLVEIIFALWLGLAIFYPEHRPRFNAVSMGLFIFLTSLTVSSLLGIDINRSFWSTQERALGLFALFHFAALFLVLSNFIRLGIIKWRNYLSFCLAVSFIAAFFAVIQLTYPSLFLEKVNDRPGSFFGNPTFLAAYLLFNIFTGLWLFVEYLKSFFKTYSLYRGSLGRLAPILVLITVILEIVVVFLTQTRGALLGLVAGFFAMLFYFSIYGNRELGELIGFTAPSKLIQKISIALLLFILCLGGIFWLTRTAAIWQSVPVLQRASMISLDDPGLRPRLLALKISWQSFLDRPFLGWGFENFKYPFDRHYDPRLLRSGFVETYFDKPHNVFMEYLVTGGVIGFTAFFALIAALFYSLWKFKRDNQLPVFIPFGAAALVSYLIQNFFVFDTFGSYLMFFVLAAFIDAGSKLDTVRKTGMVISRRYQSAALVGLLMVSLSSVYFINFKTLYANNQEYWGLNYFLNKMPAEALDRYVAALTITHPYVNQVRRDFAASLSQVYLQGLKIPDAEKVVAKAMEELASAIKSQPNDYFTKESFADYSTVFYVLDKNYIKLGEEAALKALEISPKRQQVYYTLAKFKIIEGKKKEALDLMKQSVDLDPEVGDPHFYYAFMAFETGDQGLGFKELNRAKELGRDFKNASEARLLANYYADAGDYHNAAGLYETALGANPEDVESKLKLGLVYFYSGRKDLAKEKISQVIVSLPDFKKSENFQKIKPIVEMLGISF